LPQSVFAALPFGDIAKGPDAAVVLTVFSIDGGRVAVEDTPIFQFDLVAAGLFRMRVEVPDPGEERFGIFGGRDGVAEDELIVGGADELGWKAEDFDELAILEDLTPGGVDDENAVDGGIDLGFEEGCFGLQLDLESFSLRDVGEDTVGENEAVCLIRVHGAVMEPEPCAVLVVEAKLDVEGGATGEEFEVGVVEAVEVGGMHS